MVVLGLLLLAVGALAIAAGLLTVTGDAEFLGMEIGQLAVFLIGIGAGVAVWWGYALIKYGTKRSLARRKEQRRLTELEKREAERRGGTTVTEDGPLPTARPEYTESDEDPGRTDRSE